MAAELQGKYQKLAQEYSKLRAQNQVLKKAVLDEQANSAAVKEQLKMKEQSMRKQEQEMESLTFRNLQLAKRVELLQEELTVTEAKGKKSKKAGDSVPQLSQEQKSIFDEDLRKKIEENERLHMQFFEVDEKHKRIEEELQAKLEVLEKEAAQHQAVLSGLTQKYMENIEKLQSEKAKLENTSNPVFYYGGLEEERWSPDVLPNAITTIKSQTLEREAKDCRHRTEECQQQLKTLHVDLSSRLNKSLYIIAEKVPFNDTECSRFNALNVPLHNRRHQLKMRDLAGQALSFIQEFVKALLNFHTYTEQRVQIFPIDSAIDVISPLNQKFAQYLHENASYVRPLEEGMLHIFESITEETVTVLETTAKLKSFSEYLTSYMRFLQKILPYQLKSLEEECEFSLCTSNLQAKNLELYNDMKKITMVFEKLQTYISLLALPSTNPEGLLRNNYSAIFAQISAALHGLNDVLKELSKHYTQKAALEQELPTATEKLRTTNDCILSSLVALTNAAGKIATFFSNNLDYFTTSLSYGPKGESGFMNPLSAECMLQNKKKAAAYLKTLKKPCPDSVPYKEALANRRVLLSSTESREGLSQQVQQSLEKLAKLEQEKEHWMLEAQLSKVELEKENQRRADTLKSTSTGQLVGLSQENTFLSIESDHTKDETDKSWKDPIKSASLIGMLMVSTENQEAPEAESREDLIKNHYMARIVEITMQLQLADSKAVHFYAECRALAKRLAIADKSKESLAEEIKAANQSISRLQDELTTTKRSYEDQLSMMSDHLCSMNETLSKQRDEIDALKMANKGISKKNKSR